MLINVDLGCWWYLSIALLDSEYKTGNSHTHRFHINTEQVWIWRIWYISLLWRHNERDSVSNHQPHDCLPNPDQRKHKSSASLAFLRGIHRWPVNSPHKGPVTRKMFPFDDVIIFCVPWCSCWFHGNIKRQQAEELLQPREDGMFLVRESTNFPGDYTLCLCSDGSIIHYHIICKENTLTIDDEDVFENLHQLVEVSGLRSATLHKRDYWLRNDDKNSLKWSKCIIQMV